MQTNQSSASGSTGAGHGLARPGEYLTFRLGAEEYGIDILKVQEIRSYEAPTRIANAPSFVKGVINLRGAIVPIVDLRLRFKLGEAEYNSLTVMIVLNVAGRVIGIVVDSVHDVLELPSDALRDAPQIGTVVDPGFVTGLATLGDRMLILVDIERLIMAPEMSISN